MGDTEGAGAPESAKGAHEYGEEDPTLSSAGLVQESLPGHHPGAAGPVPGYLGAPGNAASLADQLKILQQQQQAQLPLGIPPVVNPGLAPMLGIAQPSAAALLNPALMAPLGLNPLLTTMQPTSQILSLLDQQHRALLQRQLELSQALPGRVPEVNSLPGRSSLPVPGAAGTSSSSGGSQSRGGSAKNTEDGDKTNEAPRFDPPAQYKLNTPEPDGPEPFPQKLFRMLNDAEDSGYSEIVCWMPSGETFSILDNYKFIRQVAPNFFQHSKMSSFTRQLQLYHFRRVVEAGNVDCYKHPDFKKDHPELLYKIRRSKRKKATGAMVAAAPASKDD